MTMANVVLAGDNRMTHNIPDTNKVYSWDRQEGESSSDYERFECYRRQGPSRSIRQAYIGYLIDTVGEMEVKARQMASPYAMSGYPKNWGRMAKRNHWLERASAFDDHQHSLDMAVENDERERCRELRRSALHKLLTAGQEAIGLIDLSDSNLSHASTAIRTAVRELRTEYHDHDTQVEVNAMLAVIPNELRQGILAMLQVKTTATLPPGSIIDNDDTNDTNDDNG